MLPGSSLRLGTVRGIEVGVHFSWLLAAVLVTWSLAQGWSRCELKMVPMAGHALSEPGISEALVRVMDTLRQPGLAPD